MPEPTLWTVNHLGSVYKLSLQTKKWKRMKNTKGPVIATYDDVAYSDHDRLAMKDHQGMFKRVSVARNTAWGIGSDMNIYMCMLYTDLPIRVMDSCYENERWSLRKGWSAKSMFPTDRWHWSSEDGKIQCPRESFKLPSGCWSWDGDWFLDTSIPCDEDGWQYAVDFPQTYYAQQGKTSFVRRKKWSRYRKFVVFDCWSKIQYANHATDPFQDITIGGVNLVCQKDEFVAVWALTVSGKVLFRKGVWHSCPEGEEWIDVPVGDLNFVQISVGAYGLVWGTTWEGSAAVRIGITHYNPIGTHWMEVEQPCPDTDEGKLLQVSVGTRVVWALSMSTKIYFRRDVDSTSSMNGVDKQVGSSWVEMVGAFSFVDVGPNDQVWAVGSEDGLIYARTDVSTEELVGREWKLLKERDPREADKTANESKHNWVWLNSGGCDVDSTYFKQMVLSPSLQSIHSPNKNKLVWRKQILQMLSLRNNNEVEDYKKFENSTEFKGSSHWSKRTQCQVMIDFYYRTWCKCHMKLMSGYEEHEPVLLVYHSEKHEYQEDKILLCEITAINRLHDPMNPFTFTVNTLDRTANRQPLTIKMESETELKDWMTTISSETASYHAKRFKNSSEARNALWTTTIFGDIFRNQVNPHTDSILGDMFWEQIGGHLRKVICGRDGIVWGIGFDKKIYVYKEGIEDFTHESHEEMHVYENQRWNPVEGFTNRRLPSDRWGWSDKTGVIKSPKDTFQLPSLNYKWVGDWVIDYEVEGGTDKKGWQYAVDFPRWYHNYKGIHDYVRRRRWKRLCKITTCGPWMEIKTDVKVATVSLEMNQPGVVSSSQQCSVWAVGCNGCLLYRDGVTKDRPEGKSWKHISTEIPLASISVGLHSRVWALAVDGSSYVRAGFKENPKIGTNWFHVDRQDVPLCGIAAGDKLVLAIDKEGSVYYRDSITPTFPEGTQWCPFLHNISGVSVGPNDQVWLVRGNDIEFCSGLQVGNMNNLSLVCVLTGVWEDVCIRGWCIESSQVEEAQLEEEKEDGGCDSDEKMPITENGIALPKVDPYKTDIFNLYGGSASTYDVSELDFDIDFDDEASAKI